MKRINGPGKGRKRCTSTESRQNNVSASKKKAKKLTLKTQVRIRIRKKVLKQGICITFFTRSRRQRLLEETVKIFLIPFAENPPDIPDAASLIGQRICHKFELAETHQEQWYYGCVLGYDVTNEVIYNGEDQCCFDLTRLDNQRLKDFRMSSFRLYAVMQFLHVKYGS